MVQKHGSNNNFKSSKLNGKKHSNQEGRKGRQFSKKAHFSELSDDELIFDTPRKEKRNSFGGSDKHSKNPITTFQAKVHRNFSKETQFENPYSTNNKYSKKKQIEHNQKKSDPTKPVRLNKFLANAGFCSRREADEYIQAGVVTVNGIVVSKLGTSVIPATDKVLFHDQLVRGEKKVYVLLNKPKDCVTTVEDTNARLTVMDLVKNACTERIYPVGRLDRNTTGVLLLTNDGELTEKLTHPRYSKKKIYHAFLNKELQEDDYQKIANGLELEDGPIKVDEIDYIEVTDRKQIGIEIHSGRNRIVRRIFEHLGYDVVKLDRVYFAGLTKKNLSRGQWRYLTDKEINMLQMGGY